MNDDGPRTYSEIITDYKEYERLQKITFCSFESDNLHWRQGQERFVKAMFTQFPKSIRILDIACGDGVGLKELQSIGFENVKGVEFNSEKVQIARSKGFQVIECDMHKLKGIQDDSFDVVYSSHTLEHAYYPEKALAEMRRVMVSNGLLVIVLPYPDRGSNNQQAHGGKYELGLDRDDSGQAVIQFFTHRGFQLEYCQMDSFREPEIWLVFRKKTANKIDLT